MRKSLIAGLAVAASIAFVSSAGAATLSGFGDPLSDPALTGGTQEGFDTTAAGLYNSITIGAVTYSGIGAPLTIGTQYNGMYNTSGGQSLYNDTDLLPAQFRFDFSSTVTAFGFNWGAADNTWLLQAFDAAGNLLDSLALLATGNSNKGDFFGLSTGSAIAYVLLTDQKGNSPPTGDWVFIDNFTTDGQSIGQSAVVPLPGAAILLLSGLGLLGGLSLRRRRTA